MKGGKYFAAIVTMLSFITIAWFSCTKVNENLRTCNGVICQNGAYCRVDTTTKKPVCHCPTGYEGPTCATISIDKFVDTWDLTQVITGSDSTIGAFDTTTRYTVFLKKTATPTTFFINNFVGNPYYNEIVCTLDSLNSRIFTIDTISAYHMLFDHFQLVRGFGSISDNDSVIRASLYTRHLSVTSNWINDTFQLTMTRHKF